MEVYFFLSCILATTLAAPTSPDHTHVHGFSYHQDFEGKNKSDNKVEKWASLDGKLFLRYDPPENRIIFGLRDFVLHITAPGKEAKDFPINSTDFYVYYNDNRQIESVQTTKVDEDTTTMYIFIASTFQLNKKVWELDTKVSHDFRAPLTYGHGKCNAHYVFTPTSDAFKISESFNASDCEWDLTKIDSDEVDNPPKTSVSTTYTYKDTDKVELYKTSEIDSVTDHELETGDFIIRQRFTAIGESEFDGYRDEERIMEKKWPVSGDIADNYVSFMMMTVNEEDIIKAIAKVLEMMTQGFEKQILNEIEASNTA